MFQNFLNQSELKWAVDQELIVIGNTTWQIKNIASVRVESESAKLTSKKPLFRAEKPRRQLLRRILQALILLPFAYVLLWAVMPPAFQDMRGAGYASLAAALLVSGLFIWFVSHRMFQRQLVIWNQAKAVSAEQRCLWEELAADPPQLHSLIFDATSGRALVLRSLNAAGVQELQTVIVAGMRAPGAQRVTGSISVVVDDSPVDTLYDAYYGQRRSALA